MLHVLTGAACNNNCVFCMESDREARRRAVLAQTPEDLRAAIHGYPDRDHVLFTSGEPTLNEDLPALVREARDAGFRIVAVITNGRRLSYRAYAEALVAAGVNRFTISIHGHTPRIHDGLTGVRGAFSQTAQGLEHLAALRRTHRLDVHTSTVVVRRNLSHAAEVHRFLAARGVDRMCFNVVMAKGRGAERLEDLMPRYPEVAAVFRDLVRGLAAAERRRISIADIPRCCVPGIPVEVVGDQEHFEQFERTDSLGVGGLAHEDLGLLAVTEVQGGDAAARLLARSAAADLAADGRYYLTTRELKDGLLRVKRDLCTACRYDAACPGVWRTYVDRFGWEDFPPVRDPGRGTGEGA